MGYHVWCRGKRRRAVFRDAEDKRVFLNIIRRHLSELPEHDRWGRPYRKLGGQVRIFTFALLPNHFHLVLFQLTRDGVKALMHSTMRAYVAHFNAKYGETGQLFAGAYRARELDTDGKIRTAIAYVHDNHGSDCFCEFCGHRYYAENGSVAPSWMAVDQALEIFGGRQAYARFRRGRQRMKQLAA